LITDPDERTQAYGDLDKLVMSKAAVLPWVFDNDVVVRSPDVDLVINLFNALVDISYTSIRR
jgi:ABC-type oligopeptide transport system substrate-binding subunit